MPAHQGLCTDDLHRFQVILRLQHHYKLSVVKRIMHPALDFTLFTGLLMQFLIVKSNWLLIVSLHAVQCQHRAVHYGIQILMQ